VRSGLDAGRVRAIEIIEKVRFTMTDTIFIRELKTEAIIGVFDWERKVRQTVSFDFEFPGNIRHAAKTDHIDDTLDYKKVAKHVLSFVEASEFQLVETLAERVAELVLREFDLDWVRLVLSKPGALRGSRDVGVSIQRTRADFVFSS